jgi:hypothetical protein
MSDQLIFRKVALSGPVLFDDLQRDEPEVAEHSPFQ